MQETWRRLAGKATASFAVRSRTQSHLPHGKPKSWIKPYISPRFREVVLYRKNEKASDNDFSDCDARLLPGGQYLLFRHNTLLQCWSLVEKNIIWQYERELDPGVEFHRGLIFAFEVVGAGRFVIIIAVTNISLGTWVNHWSFQHKRLLADPPFRSVAEIMRLEFKTGKSCCLFSRPIESHGKPFLSCYVSGDFVLLSKHDMALILQISRKSCHTLKVRE